jgi:hypothetical protein
MSCANRTLRRGPEARANNRGCVWRKSALERGRQTQRALLVHLIRGEGYPGSPPPAKCADGLP